MRACNNDKLFEEQTRLSLCYNLDNFEEMANDFAGKAVERYSISGKYDNYKRIASLDPDHNYMEMGYSREIANKYRRYV